MITEKRLEEALKYLADTDVQNAETNAKVKYLDRLLKRKKALHITGNTHDKSISAKEQSYYASETYEKAIQKNKRIHCYRLVGDDFLSIFCIRNKLF